MKPLIPYATILTLGATAVMVVGCGNGWVTSKDREKSPSAMMLRAQLLYDKGKFAEAASAYQDIINVNPQNERARVRLSYALNGAAGLGPLALLTRLSKIQSASTAAPASGASQATTTANSASKNSLTQLTSAAGLTSQEIAAVSKANPKTFQDLLNAQSKFASLASSDAATFAHLVSASNRFRKLQESWRAICQLIPKRVLDSVIGTSAVRKRNLDSESCLGGLQSDYQKPAVLFAAAIGTLAQGAALYQVKLDTNNDGVIDAIKTAETLTKDIAALNSASGTTTDPAAIKTKIDSLNTKVTALNGIGQTLQHELVDLAMAQFEIMSLLMTSIEDVIPENVGKSLLGGVKKFEEAKAKIGGYVKTGTTASTGKTTATKQDKISTSAATASKAADAYYDKYKEQIASDPQAATKQAAFDASFAQTCSQFDVLKTTYGATAATKPSSCAKLGLGLAFAPEDTLPFSLKEADLEEAVAGLAGAPAAEPDYAVDAQADFLEFVRLGDRLLRAD